MGKVLEGAWGALQCRRSHLGLERETEWVEGFGEAWGWLTSSLNYPAGGKERAFFSRYVPRVAVWQSHRYSGFEEMLKPNKTGGKEKGKTGIWDRPWGEPCFTLCFKWAAHCFSLVPDPPSKTSSPKLGLGPYYGSHSSLKSLRLE